jgi:hypothetical protein
MDVVPPLTTPTRPPCSVPPEIVAVSLTYKATVGVVTEPPVIFNLPLKMTTPWPSLLTEPPGSIFSVLPCWTLTPQLSPVLVTEPPFLMVSVSPPER